MLLKVFVLKYILQLYIQNQSEKEINNKADEMVELFL